MMVVNPCPARGAARVLKSAFTRVSTRYARSGAPQMRDPGCLRHDRNRGPGSAAQHKSAALRPGHEMVN